MVWANPRLAAMVLAFAMAVCGGCVRRTIFVTSEPEGALVYLNDTEVGRTPVEVDFVYYGDYDVRLVKEGFEPIVTNAKAKAPIWDFIGLDLLAEAVPGEPHSQVRWHYQLVRRNDDTAPLLERATELRGRVVDPAVETAAPAEGTAASTGTTETPGAPQ